MSRQVRAGRGGEPPIGLVALEKRCNDGIHGPWAASRRASRPFPATLASAPRSPLGLRRLTLRATTDMGTTMRHWARVTMLLLATSACKDSTTIESPPAAAPAAAPEREHEGIEPPPHGNEEGGGDGIGFFTKKRVEPAKPSHAGGLMGLTREVIETARRTVGDPVQLVPDAALYVGRARPAVLLGHAEAQAVWAKVEESDASFKTAMDVVRACLGRLEAIDDLVIGFDEAEHVVLVAHATALGTDATWRCFQTETISRGKPFELVITGTARGEGPQLRSDDDDGFGYFPDDDTVVMVSKEWDADVQARLRGEGTAAVEGSLVAPVARVQQGDPMWLVGRITGKSESGLAGSPMAGIDDVAVDLRLEGVDLLVTTSVDAGEAADATRVRDAVQKQVDEFKAMLPMMGMPSSIIPKLAFVAEGDLVKLDLSFTGDELKSLREGVERTF
jgi:hypothetical protein